MSRFLDGPAAGFEPDLRRAPMYVRVVGTLGEHGMGCGPTCDRGHWKLDVLDQLDDEPREGERIFVYEAVPSAAGAAGVVFACRGGKGGGRYEYRDYRHRDDVDGEQFRDNETWRAWAQAQPAID